MVLRHSSFKHTPCTRYLSEQINEERAAVCLLLPALHFFLLALLESPPIRLGNARTQEGERFARLIYLLYHDLSSNSVYTIRSNGRIFVADSVQFVLSSTHVEKMPEFKSEFDPSRKFWRRLQLL